MNGKHTVCLLLGGNLGNVAETFDRVEVLTKNKIGEIECKSNIYESEPWGFTSENNFLNVVFRVSTSLSPEDLLKCVLQIENELGRERAQCAKEYASRIVDIDILFYDSAVYQSKTLTIPHPKLHERKFTLLPLNEIAANYRHPVLNETVSSLLQLCNDRVPVWKK